MSLSKFETKLKNGQNWFRLAAAVNELLDSCLLPILHRSTAPYQGLAYTGLPEDEHILFNTLSDPQHKPQLDNLLRRRIIKQYQYDILRPSTGRTDVSQFDTTLIGLLFRTFSGLATLNGNWRVDLLDPTDTTLASFVVKFIDLRNRLFHWGNIEKMTETESNTFWSEIISLAHGLQYGDKITKFQSVSLDPDNALTNRIWQQRLATTLVDLETKQEDLETNQKNLKTDHKNIEKKQANLEVKQDNLETKQEDLETNQKNLETNHGNMEKKQDNLEVKQDNLETKQDNLETKQEDLETDQKNLKTDHKNMEKKQANLETKQDNLEIKQEELETNQKNLETNHGNMEKKQDNLEVKQDNLETKQEDLETDQNNLKTDHENMEKKQAQSRSKTRQSRKQNKII